MIREFPTAHEPHDDSVENSPIVKLWYAVLADCLKHGCERIHIAPSQSGTFAIRACTQGAWEQIMAPTIKMYPAFLQRLKIMAGFSMAKRLPTEEGRFRLAVRDSVYEIGVTVRAQPDGTQDAMLDLPLQPVQSSNQ